MNAASQAHTLVDPFSASRFDALVKVASGGMASVWVGVPRARRGVAHLVALKRPHQHLVEDPGFKQVLVAEAAVASRLHHENVVSVRELEVVGDTVQLVMDYVEGAALGQLLVRASKGGPALPTGVAVQIVLDVAAGLEVLHGLTDASGAPLGFVHRDVSPQNVLVGADGRSRITDFGLAKCARASEQPTTQGTLKGKLGYMAPEYVRGAVIDRRADVFALGVVLWEALTGKRLFRGDNDADTLERVCRAPITPPSAIVPGLAAFDAVVARALERAPEARYASARELREALLAAATSAGVVLDRRETIVHVEAAFGAEIDQRRRDLLRLLDEGTPVPEDRSARDRLRTRNTALALGGATAAAALLL
ncbi:serine/threonine protein kinase, partial [Myxococcota bacterium]|nr:serine/threonine protein kinase [Myxococcota bacterium]